LRQPEQLARHRDEALAGDQPGGDRDDVDSCVRRCPALTFDGLDSDGSDESDLAIYDAAGTRIAVYTALYGDNSAVGDMTAAVDAHVPEVEVPFHR
jgi:hypothetical protein